VGCGERIAERELGKELGAPTRKGGGGRSCSVPGGGKSKEISYKSVSLLLGTARFAKVANDDSTEEGEGGTDFSCSPGGS